MLNLKDECNNRAFGSSLLGFKIGMLNGAQVPDIEDRSSGRSVLVVHSLLPVDTALGSNTEPGL